MKTTETKIPKRVQRFISKVDGGKKVCRSLRTKISGEQEVCYFIEPGGRTCSRIMAEKAIGLGLLKPAGDALFSEADSQTWIAA
jgi:hypothetical protein